MTEANRIPLPLEAYGVKPDAFPLGSIIVYRMPYKDVHNHELSFEAIKTNPTWVTHFDELKNANEVIGRNGKPSDISIVWEENSFVVDGTSLPQELMQNPSDIEITDLPDGYRGTAATAIRQGIVSEAYVIVQAPTSRWDDIKSCIEPQYLVSGSNNRSGPLRDWHIYGSGDIPFTQ